MHLSEAIALGTLNMDAGTSEDAICIAACALAECYGATDYAMAAEAVCRAQSCSARARLRRLFLRASAPNNRQALFMRLLAHLARGNTLSTDMRLADEARRVLSHLSVAWRRLDISADFSVLRNALPSNTIVVVLALPPGQRTLYAAVFARPDPAVESANKAVREARKLLSNTRRNLSEKVGVSASNAAEESATTALLSAEGAASALYGTDCAVSRQSLGSEGHASLVALAADCAAWRKQLAPFLMRHENDNVGDHCDAADQGTGQDSEPGHERNRPNGARRNFRGVQDGAGEGRICFGGTGDRFEAELHDLLERTEDLIGSLFANSSILSALLTRFCRNAGHVILCVPELLETLPLEGLKAFSGAGAVARDFSAHMFHHRLTTYRDQGSKPCSAISTAVVADPRHEDTHNHRKQLSDHRPGNDKPGTGGAPVTKNLTILETLAATRNKINIGGLGEDATNKEGNVLTGASQIPSTGQWQRLLAGRDGGGYIYYGLGRMLAYLAPEFVAGLDLSRCPLALLLDQSLNDEANRRQSKADNQKSTDALELETPSSTAAILSLAGINTIVLNQWGTSFASNSRMCQELFFHLKKGMCVGEAVTQTCRQYNRGKLRLRINAVIYGLPSILFSSK